MATGGSKLSLAEWRRPENHTFLSQFLEMLGYKREPQATGSYSDFPWSTLRTRPMQKQLEALTATRRPAHPPALSGASVPGGGGKDVMDFKCRHWVGVLTVASAEFLVVSYSFVWLQNEDDTTVRINSTGGD